MVKSGYVAVGMFYTIALLSVEQTDSVDGAELVEEYDVKTGEILLRKQRGKTILGKESEWDYIVGEPPTRWNPDQGTIKESSMNPIFTRKDTRDAFQWRIRNLPYPPEVYSVSIEEPERRIVIRTSNKKYFKRFNIPEMDKLQLPLVANAVTWSHSNNTLIVSYAKPQQVIQAEKHELEENKKLRAKEEGDVDCKQQ